MFITKDLFVVAQNARFEPMQGNEMFPNVRNRARMRGRGHGDHPHAKHIVTNRLRGVRSVDGQISEILNVLLRLKFCLIVERVPSRSL